MDRIEKNKNILVKVLKQFEAMVNRPESNIRSELFIDTIKNTYILMTFGWTSERFIHFVAFHFEIKPDGKIWLYQNRTNELIIEEIIDLGVDENDVVLALVEPYDTRELVTA